MSQSDTFAVAVQPWLLSVSPKGRSVTTVTMGPAAEVVLAVMPRPLLAVPSYMAGQVCARLTFYRISNGRPCVWCGHHVLHVKARLILIIMAFPDLS